MLIHTALFHLKLAPMNSALLPLTNSGDFLQKFISFKGINPHFLQCFPDSSTTFCPLILYQMFKDHFVSGN